MKGIIIYKGRYGATQQYAQWLSEETGFNVLPASVITQKQLDQYDLIIIGSSVYIGQLEVKKWLKKNCLHLTKKRILFFQVAGTLPEEKEKREVYNKAGIPAEIMKNCEFYYLPGRLIIKKLSWWDRFMLKMGARFTKDPAAKKTMLTDYDHVKKDNIRILADRIKQIVAVEESQTCMVTAR